MLISIETHRTCDFLGGRGGGRVRTTLPPLDPRIQCWVGDAYFYRNL